MTFLRTVLCTSALALLGLPAAAGAQAFGLNEIGSCALARGFAATADPCDDASSIFWNPGSLPKTPGFSFYGGAAIIGITGDFTRDTSFTTYKGDVPNQVVPHVFLNYRGAGRLAYGIGAYVPYGLTSQWADDFPGRFSRSRRTPGVDVKSSPSACAAAVAAGRSKSSGNASSHCPPRNSRDTSQ